MINSLLEPFTYGYMLNAIWVSALVGGVCGFLSAYLMLKGWSLIGDALSHAIVPGVAGAYMLGLPFSLGAFLSGGLAAGSMLFLNQKTRLKEDAIIGLIPNVGDTITSLASFYILIAGVRYGVPKITLLRMAFNIGLDYAIGSIPFIGDAFDFFWKANKQNLDLIRERATGHGKGTTSDYVFIFVLIGLLILLLIGSIVASAIILYYIFNSMPLI